MPVPTTFDDFLKGVSHLNIMVNRLVTVTTTTTTTKTLSRKTAPKSPTEITMEILRNATITKPCENM